ncbi:MAG TPA: 2OG-Fe(II) oxygenase [Solimonas sp.]|nr:2OG-Fe(II) oxygenase [Solimonas sp.]
MLRSRDECAALIAEVLRARGDDLRAQFAASGPIRHVVIDDFLGAEIAAGLYAAVPPLDRLVHHVSLRERKYIGVQMNEVSRELEEAVFAFQHPAVVARVREITGIDDLRPDPNLYAGGISVMSKGGYLNPHIDNSHDKDRALWRVLNLLYYVTPDWSEAAGGSLELWPRGVKKTPLTIPARCDRLVIMETHQTSWHSVSPITADGRRCCVSNYYFSPQPVRADDRFHITFFRGRPERPLWDAALLADGYLRTGIRKLFKHGIRENPHVYKRADS